MTRTLADMTPAERQECVGRWAEVRRHLVIIAEIDEQRGDATVFRPETQNNEWHNLPDVTPRLDLPRAWTPDGEPADMDVETGRVEYGRIWYGSEIMERTNLPDGTTVHRHVTDWEEA